MARASRLAAVIFVLAGGVIHYHLWHGGYRGIAYIGPLFLANTVASGVVALALLVFRNNAKVVLAGLALSVGALIALVMSRTTGILGFTDPGWTPDAYRAIAAEGGAIVSLALVATTGRLRRPVRRAPAVATG